MATELSAGGVGGPALGCRPAWLVRVATLIDFALNCWGCDAATHLGCAGLTGRRETARAQLEKDTGMDAEEAQALLDAAGEEWGRALGAIVDRGRVGRALPALPRAGRPVRR